MTCRFWNPVTYTRLCTEGVVIFCGIVQPAIPHKIHTPPVEGFPQIFNRGNMDFTDCCCKYLWHLCHLELQYRVFSHDLGRVCWRYNKSVTIVQPGNKLMEHKHTSWITQNRYTLVPSVCMISCGIAPQTNCCAGWSLLWRTLLSFYLRHAWPVYLPTPFGNERYLGEHMWERRYAIRNETGNHRIYCTE